MVVADTTVWIDYVRGLQAPHTNALDHELLHNQVITGDLLMAEFLQGFRNDKDFEAAKEIMNSLIYYDMPGKDMALKSAVNFRLLPPPIISSKNNSYLIRIKRRVTSYETIPAFFIRGRNEVPITATVSDFIRPRRSFI